MFQRGARLHSRGIFDPVPRGSQQPGYGTRLAFSHGADDRPLTLAIGGYYDRRIMVLGIPRTDGRYGGLVYTAGKPVCFSGEAYRGRALGHLGAAQGRSVILAAGIRPGIEDDRPERDRRVGQLKFKASDSVDFHAAHGEIILIVATSCASHRPALRIQ
jgi:hypothetical protein